MNGAHACLTQDRRRTARNALVEEELHDVVGVTTVSSANIAAAYASAWSDVLILQLGVVRSELFPRRVGAQCFEHTAYRQTHSTDTGLAVHLSRLDGDAVKLALCRHFVSSNRLYPRTVRPCLLGAEG